MGPDDNLACPQCDTIGCREKYGEMLALEYEQSTVFGAVHHITVTCYNLQHPDFFSDEALAWMWSSLRDMVENDLSGQELLKRARGEFSGDFKVRRRDARARAPGRTCWSMTAAGIRTDRAEAYVEDVRAWAKSILKDLGTH